LLAGDESGQSDRDPSPEKQPPKAIVIPRREINLPPEPEVENSDSLEIKLRMPVSGERVSRRFLKSDTV